MLSGKAYICSCTFLFSDVLPNVFCLIFKAFFGVFDGHGGSKAAEFASENLDRNILNEVEKMGEIEIIEAIKQGYMNTDSQFLTQDQRGGSCCLTAIIRDNNLVVSNAGDCRAVVSIGGTATPLTSDHRPSRQDEKLRIELLVSFFIKNLNRLKYRTHNIWFILFAY